MISPNTEVRLLSSVPFNNTYEHTRYFDNISDQTNYFLGKSQFTFSDFTYQREEQAIRVPKAYDELYLCNYVMYKNTSFGNKWFYGFITHKEYVNPDFTKVYFEIDVLQTWLFDLTWKQSFIEREHRDRWNADGTPVLNTVDEGLNYGTEYEMVSVEQFVPFNDVFFLVIVCKQRMDTNSSEITPVLNGGITPLTHYIVPFKMDGSDPGVTVDGINQTISPAGKVLKALYTLTNAVNNIAAIYITEYIGISSLSFSMTQVEPVTIQDASETITALYVKDLPYYSEMTHDFGNKYDGFSTVTESKLLMHPYTVTILTDMKGNHQEIKNEYIQDMNLSVNVKGSIGVSNKVAYTVNQYLNDSAAVNNDRQNLNYAVINNNPNDVPVITDLLSAYLQGNRNQLENQKAGIIWNQAFGAIGNSMTKNVGGVIAGAGNGYLEMAGLLAKQKDIANTPPQITRMGGNTAFDYGNMYQGLYVIKKQITAEYIKKLTDFFKLYGYKVNELKIPNLHTRSSFNFVKTVGANVTGNIPNDQLDTLKGIFDKGITLWHTDDVLNYGLGNDEI
jgi:hypothetical protein